MNIQDKDQPIFYEGETVIAVDAIKGSLIKNGQLYTVYHYQYKANPVNRLHFWYIGVIHANGTKSHDWIRPSIFAPIQRAKLISFERVMEQSPIYAN